MGLKGARRPEPRLGMYTRPTHRVGRQVAASRRPHTTHCHRVSHCVALAHSRSFYRRRVGGWGGGNSRKHRARQGARGMGAYPMLGHLSEPTGGGTQLRAFLFYGALSSLDDLYWAMCSSIVVTVRTVASIGCCGQSQVVVGGCYQ